MGLEELKLGKVKSKAEKYDEEKLREVVMEAVEDSKRGSGFEIGQPEFYRTILRSIAGNEELKFMTSVRFGIWKSRINKVIKELKQQEENKTHSDAEETKKQESVITDKERAKMIESAKKSQWREIKRSGGVDVEDL